MSRYTVRVARGKTVEVASLLAAGRAVRAEIEGPLGWMGSTEWHRTVARSNEGVPVYEGDDPVPGSARGVERGRRPVATVSYNGRVWTPDGAEVTR